MTYMAKFKRMMDKLKKKHPKWDVFKRVAETQKRINGKIK